MIVQVLVWIGDGWTCARVPARVRPPGLRGEAGALVCVVRHTVTDGELQLFDTNSRMLA